MSAGRLTSEEWRARAEAYHEAAAHLMQNWTDDPVERRQGDVVSRKLHKFGDAAIRYAVVRERRDAKTGVR